MNHFASFPLISPKVVSYSLWAEVLVLMLAGQHLTTTGFSYIQTVYAALGRGASKSVMQAFPTLTPITLPSYVVPVTAETINPWWISGYLTLYCSFDLSVLTEG